MATTEGTVCIYVTLTKKQLEIIDSLRDGVPRAKYIRHKLFAEQYVDSKDWQRPLAERIGY